jgi:hypothetical protein
MNCSPAMMFLCNENVCCLVNAPEHETTPLEIAFWRLVTCPLTSVMRVLPESGLGIWDIGMLI